MRYLTTVVFASVLALPWAALAAPDLTNKSLSVTYRDPNRVNTATAANGINRTVVITFEAGTPGQKVRARLAPLSVKNSDACGPDAIMLGTYSSSGLLQLKLTNDRGRCRPAFAHEVELTVANDGSVRGEWGADFVASKLPADGTCLDCRGGSGGARSNDEQGTHPLVIVGIIASIVGYFAWKHQQDEKAKRAAPVAIRRTPPATEDDDGPTLSDVHKTGVEDPAAKKRRLEEADRQRRAAEEARRKAEADANRRRPAEDAARRRAAEELARRKAAQDKAKQEQERAAIEAEHERLRQGIGKTAGALISRVEDPKRRAFYLDFMKRHQDNPEKMRLALGAIAKHMEGEGDPAAKEAEWEGRMEKHLTDIRDWALRVNRLLPGGKLIVAGQSALYSTFEAASNDGATGAAFSLARTAAGLHPLADAAWRVAENKGNVVQALDDKLSELDYRTYVKRMGDARKKIAQGEWKDGIAEVLDTALDAKDSAEDVNDARKAIKSRLSTPVVPASAVAAAAKAKVKAKAGAETPKPQSPRFENDPAKRAAWPAEFAKLKEANAARIEKALAEARAKRVADAKKWREKSKDLKGTSVGNVFEKGFKGWDRDRPHIHVEDLDDSFKTIFNPTGETNMTGARSPLIDKRLFIGEDAARPGENRNRAGFVSVAASHADSGGDYYVNKFVRLLSLPYDSDNKAVQKLLKFLRYDKDPSGMIDMSSMWVPHDETNKAYRDITAEFLQDGKYDFSKIQKYVDHMQANDPSLKTGADVMRELLKKVEGRVPWADD